MSCSNPRTRGGFRSARLSRTAENDIDTISRCTSAAKIHTRESRKMSIFSNRKHKMLKRKKQNAGTLMAFRRLNYAVLTLIGESDAKSRHSEILMVAAVTGPELHCRVDNRLGEDRKSVDFEDIIALLGDEVKLVRVVFLTENE